MKKFLAFLAAIAATLVITPGVAKADAPTIPWTGTNPYVFAVGDSIVQQCGEKFGMDWRSLGFVGWPGADSNMMKERLTSGKEGYPFTTESSSAEERQWFRDAGALVVGLGTNDVKVMTAEQFRANIDWFMGQARNRPVEWFTIHNPPFKAQSDAFNAELRAATVRYPNLQLLDWDKVVDQNPSIVLSDGVHVATSDGCDNYRNKLIQIGAPDEPGKETAKGYWYYDARTTGTVYLNGWGAGNDNNRTAPLWVNVRSNYQHVERFPITGSTGDVWAQAASGRAFSIALPEKYRGTIISVDLVDSTGRFTYLGDRKV